MRLVTRRVAVLSELALLMADEVLAADLEALVARVAAEQDDGRAEGVGLAATAREGAVGARVEGYASEARAAEVALAGLEALVARVAAAEDDAEAAYALQEVESGGRERAVARDAVAREDEAETEIGGFAAGEATLWAPHVRRCLLQLLCGGGSLQTLSGH